MLLIKKLIYVINVYIKISKDNAYNKLIVHIMWEEILI